MVAARPFIEKNFHPTIVVGAYYKVSQKNNLQLIHRH